MHRSQNAIKVSVVACSALLHITAGLGSCVWAAFYVLTNTKKMQVLKLLSLMERSTFVYMHFLEIRIVLCSS